EPVRLSVYLQRGSRELSAPRGVIELIEALKRPVPFLSGGSFSEPSSGRLPLPRSVRDFVWEYHVSCSVLGHACPEWRRALISWSKHQRGSIQGELVDQ